MSEKAKETEENFSFKCPICSEGMLKITHSLYDLPDKEKMLILKFECNKCDFNKNDIIPVETQMKPGIMTLKIVDEQDLKSKIYRAPTGRIEIPELELVVEPGRSAKFYYTNVEGILFRFEEAVSIYRNNLEVNDPQIQGIDQLLDDLKKAMCGELQFTLKITDRLGGSYVIPQRKENYTFEELSNEGIDTD